LVGVEVISEGIMTFLLIARSMLTLTFFLTLRIAEEQGFFHDYIAVISFWASSFSLCIPRTLIVRPLTIRAIVLSIEKIDYKKIILRFL